MWLLTFKDVSQCKNDFVLLYLYKFTLFLSPLLLDKSKKASPKKNEKAQPSPVSEPIKTAEELAVYRQISKKNHDLNELYLGDLRRICRVSYLNV